MVCTGIILSSIQNASSRCLPSNTIKFSVLSNQIKILPCSKLPLLVNQVSASQNDRFVPSNLQDFIHSVVFWKLLKTSAAILCGLYHTIRKIELLKQ
jgi:hypothetical protein